MAQSSRSALSKLKDHAVGVLVKMMASPDAKLANKALRILEEIRTSKALEAIKTALSHKTPAIRVRAAWIIARADGPTEELVPHLIEYMITSKEHPVIVARVLKKLGEKVIPPLTEAFKNPDDDARFAVYSLLREFYTYQSAIPLLETASKDKSRKIRENATRYLHMAREHQKGLKNRN
jgi:HEAT repeat protein